MCASCLRDCTFLLSADKIFCNGIHSGDCSVRYDNIIDY
jgi:hypothetical protein